MIGQTIINGNKLTNVYLEKELNGQWKVIEML